MLHFCHTFYRPKNSLVYKKRQILVRCCPECSDLPKGPLEGLHIYNYQLVQIVGLHKSWYVRSNTKNLWKESNCQILIAFNKFDELLWIPEKNTFIWGIDVKEEMHLSKMKVLHMQYFYKSIWTNMRFTPFLNLFNVDNNSIDDWIIQFGWF